MYSLSVWKTPHGAQRGAVERIKSARSSHNVAFLLSAPSFQLTTPTVEASRYDHCFNQYPVHTTLHWPKWTNIHKPEPFFSEFSKNFRKLFCLQFYSKRSSLHERHLRKHLNAYKGKNRRLNNDLVNQEILCKKYQIQDETFAIYFRFRWINFMARFLNQKLRFKKSWAKTEKFFSFNFPKTENLSNFFLRVKHAHYNESYWLNSSAIFEILLFRL